MTSDKHLQRTWQHIAEEATQETDPRRLLKLIEELVSAVKELHRPHTDEKGKEPPVNGGLPGENTSQ